MLNLAAGTSGYNLTNSLRFRSSANGFLNRTPSVAGSGTTFTLSAWVKRGKLGANQVILCTSASLGTNVSVLEIDFTSSDTLDIFVYSTPTTNANLITTQVFRDPSAWYHIVVAFDTTQATAANRIKLYVNGSQVTAFSTATYPSQNFNCYLNSTIPTLLGMYAASGYPQLAFDGYMAEVNLIDGQALTPSSFGSTNATTGVWQPAQYTGTYGTNGFYLKFSDIALTSGSNAGLGKDFSGNGNYWTTNNISVTAGTTYDAMTDVPTLTSATVANYCTLNPLPYYGGFSVLSRGNLQFTSGNSNWMRAFATIAVSSGKWYWEVTANNTLSQMHGISNVTNPSFYAGATNWVGYDATGYAYFSDGGPKFNNNSSVAYGASWGAGDIIGIAFDADNGKLFFSKNGTWQASGDPAAGTNAAFTGLTSGPYVPAVSVATTSGANTCDINFGQRPFSYTPPTGFNRLNTFNLPNSTVVKGNTVMDATTYTGNGTSQTITNAGAFRPDLVWLKSRSAATNNWLADSVRGVTNYLTSNSTAAEVPDGSSITAFNSNGFSLGANTTMNGSAVTYVGWQWQAGQGSTSSNTSGTITSTVSVNATAGFSVVTYSGNSTTSTIGHGLGVTPAMFIVKRRNSTGNWYVYHQSLGATKTINVNLTDAAYTTANAWNNTAPTSSVISVSGVSAEINNTGGTYVAYCWAAIPGFSAFGSYTGNGSTDGPFVYTGFRPKYILIKNSSAAYSWYVEDTSRATYNTAGATLAPNTSAAEDTAWGSGQMDILSNGFKIRISSAESNANGNTFIYAAFAENPFKNANAR